MSNTKVAMSHFINIEGAVRIIFTLLRVLGRNVNVHAMP